MGRLARVLGTLTVLGAATALVSMGFPATADPPGAGPAVADPAPAAAGPTNDVPAVAGPATDGPAAAGPTNDVPADPPLPRSMASVGDSISRAFDVSWLHPLRDHASSAWSTGTDRGVDSHYARLLRADPALKGHAYNDAQTGATMADLDRQVRTAAAQGVDYLTVLMGANDLCASSVAAMTPTATFRTEFYDALSDFFAADPGAHVLVASIPDLHALWARLHTRPNVEVKWNLLHICPSMLSWSNSPADRQAVADQEARDNAALAEVCNEFDTCRYDGGAVFSAAISKAEVSEVDWFHPDATGQKALATVTWAAGFWPDR